MKLKQFKDIMSHLPDDAEIVITAPGKPDCAPQLDDTIYLVKSKDGRIIRIEIGNSWLA